MSEIWDAEDGITAIQTIAGQGFRLVESQEQVATASIVSDLHKQSVLEEMLDDTSKPSYRPGTEHLHYLLSTAFRYPPLRHGSRFGSRFEPSLLYGGTTEHVALCVSAYYKFYFYHAIENKPVHNTLNTQHTIFSFSYRTEFGIQLQYPPFDKYEDGLRNPVDYKATQALGSAMREEGIKAFEYSSARDPDGSTNIALFDATPLTKNKPHNKRNCLCQSGPDMVTFNIDRKIIQFELDQFLADGVFPYPSQ